MNWSVNAKSRFNATTYGLMVTISKVNEYTIAYNNIAPITFNIQLFFKKKPIPYNNSIGTVRTSVIALSQ